MNGATAYLSHGRKIILPLQMRGVLSTFGTRIRKTSLKTVANKGVFVNIVPILIIVAIVVGIVGFFAMSI
jgi:hypothetical protein